MGDTRAPTGWMTPAALGLAAIAVAVLSHHFLFPAYSWNRDEPVYLWQAAALRDGFFTTPTGGFPTFFHPWLAGVRGHSFFSQYTLGWPLILLAADVVVGTPAGALALGAALTVTGTYFLARELLDDRRVPVLAALVMLVSPIVVIQSGTYLGYLFTLGLGLFFLTAVCSGVRTGKRGRLVVAGLLVGWIFMTRPFDAVLWAVGVVLVLAWTHRREPKRLLRAAVPLGLGFLPLLVATLAYNARVTGSFTQFPITAADPLDTFGFGLRRIMPTFNPANYTFLQAVRSTGKQAGLLPIFFAGSYVLGVLALWGMWRERRDTGIRVLIATALAFPVGYFFFWGMFVSSSTMPLSGPIYFIPVYPILAIVGVRELLRLWDTRRGLSIALVVAMVVLTVPVAFNRIDANRRISEAQVPWQRSSAAVPSHSLVFQWRAGGYLMFMNPFSSNSATLDGRALYAVDRGEENFALMDAYPGRKPYIQRTSVPPIGEVPNDHPKTPRVTLTPLRVLRAPAFAVHTTVHSGRMPAGARYFVRMFGQIVRSWPASGARDPSATLRVRAASSPASATGGPSGKNPEYCVEGLGTISIGIGRGRNAQVAARHPLYRNDLHYRVQSGNLEILTPIDAFRRGIYGKSHRWFTVAPGVRSPVSLDTKPVPMRK